MDPITKKFTQEEHNMIIDAIGATLEATRHHASLGNLTRFQKVLKTKLPPDYQVSCFCDKIKVWQQDAWSSNYEHRVSLYFPWCGNDAAKVRVKIQEELNRMDTRDYAERRQQEQEPLLQSRLRHMHDRVTELLHAVKSYRRAAIEAIKNLPIPHAATCRTSSVHWDSPSEQLRKDFPNLFPK